MLSSGMYIQNSSKRNMLLEIYLKNTDHGLEK